MDDSTLLAALAQGLRPTTSPDLDPAHDAPITCSTGSSSRCSAASAPLPAKTPPAKTPPAKTLPGKTAAAVTRRARARLPQAAITLGEAVATAQSAGGGDVFAILYDERRHALVLAVQASPAPGDKPDMSAVTIDIRTGAIVQVVGLPGAFEALH